jgi:hypothetical protein
MIFAQASIIATFSLVQATKRSKSEFAISSTVGFKINSHFSSIQTLTKTFSINGTSEIASEIDQANQAIVS